MPDRSSNDEDLNVLARRIVDEATAEDEAQEEPDEEARREAARILGRLGGLKGGPARAEKLSAERRKEIAKKAAEARWKDEDKNGEGGDDD